MAAYARPIKSMTATTTSTIYGYARRDHDHEAAHWDQLRLIDTAAWQEADRLSLQSVSVDPLTMHVGGGEKILFRTGTCKVFVVDLDGAGAPPEILFTPEDTIAGGCGDCNQPRLALFEEPRASGPHCGGDCLLVASVQSLIGRPSSACR
ncbi:hypothetical protein E2562_031194 [Oryza meyeriana var. granulata]|uniref:Uncharacterized protein n=1 Tax=Oryza meyeriana var. granulata TaxID=110450 RepID=A0A6G1ERH8_9ORYZ|nr:hypothetical protein E2562_031194 [Oryza meyeriana var. granulata]